MFIKVPQSPFAYIGNITGKFFLAEAGLAHFGGKFVDVNARKAIVLAEFFTDDNRVLKVKTVKRDKPHKDIFAESQHAVGGPPPICYDLAALYLVAELDDGFLIKAGSFVQPNKFGEVVFIGVVNNYLGCVHCSNDTTASSTDDHTRVLANHLFHAGTDQRRLCLQQRNRLPLHIRTHQGSVCIIVLQEWDKRS